MKILLKIENSHFFEKLTRFEETKLRKYSKNFDRSPFPHLRTRKGHNNRMKCKQKRKTYVNFLWGGRGGDASPKIKIYQFPCLKWKLQIVLEF